MTQTKTLPVSVRLPPELKAAICALASEDDRSVSNYIERVLEEHVRARAPKMLKTKR